MKRNRHGFTLVELIVVMAVFMAVLMISASAFNTILVQSSKIFRSEESNIEGVIGLEMLRHDIQQSGYGLFSEAADYANEASSTPATSYNDAPNNVPRPIVVGNDLAAVASGTLTILAGTDYLAIKGTTVGREKTAQKWTFLNFSGNLVTPHKWASNSENLSSADSEKAVLIQKQFGTPMRSSLVKDRNGDFYYAYSDIGFKHLSSASAGIYTVYGVDKFDTLRFPFNRSDYFVARPSTTDTIPAYCAPNTGMLYKATVDHDGGGLNSIPILDCVLDMQVVLGWDINLDGMVDTWSSANGAAVSGVGTVAQVQAALSNATTLDGVVQGNNTNQTTTLNIRNCLKMIKVYIIAQNGKKDTGYTSSATLDVGDTAEVSLTRASGLPLAADQRNYRWKQYRVIVRPKNLVSNQ